MSRFDVSADRLARAVDGAGGASVGFGTYLWYSDKAFTGSSVFVFHFVALGLLVALLALLDRDRRLLAVVLSLLFLYVIHLAFPLYFQTGLPLEYRDPPWPPGVRAIVGVNLGVAGAVLLLVNSLVVVTREHVLGGGTDSA